MLLLYVARGEEKLPIEVPPDATVKDACEAAGLGPHEQITFQGETLDMEAQLADTGVSSQVTLVVLLASQWWWLKEGHEGLNNTSSWRPEYWRYSEGVEDKPRVVTKPTDELTADAMGWSSNAYIGPGFQADEVRQIRIELVGVPETYDFADAIGLVDSNDGYLWNTSVAALRLPQGQISLKDVLSKESLRKPELGDTLTIEASLKAERAYVQFQINDEQPVSISVDLSKHKAPYYFGAEVRACGWSFRIK